tara:strand:- start:29 stop:484 length:456 start_codon:yes stop_codon:yes gene_type:complete
MSQNISVQPVLTNDMILKYGSIISAAVFGSIIIGYLIYLLVTSVGSGKSKFKGYSSLDSLYDEAGGNDPLSNARLTSDINLSSDKYSCKFQVIYEGNRTRKVNCIQGCDGNDDKANFCKRYEYPGGDLDLENPLLDQTFVNRKDYDDSENN